MKKEKVLMLTNIILPLILFAILLFAELSEKFMSIISLTLIIGWALPYFVLIITGLSIYNKSHKKLGLTLNILNIILLIFLIILISSIIEKKLVLILVEYILMLIISLINKYGVFLAFYMADEERISKLTPLESENIKKQFDDFKQIVSKYSKIHCSDDFDNLKQELEKLESKIINNE